MSDGADTVRNLQAYLHPSSEHTLDWFHATMRLTVMQQQTKALIEEDAAFDVETALEGLDNLTFDLDLRRHSSPAAAKLYRSIIEFDTYIRNNRDFIPNYGERFRQGDTITASFVESTINQVVSKRFVKKQQMQWTLKGAHLLLQTRTKVLNDDLKGAFRDWYPKFHPKIATPPSS